MTGRDIYRVALSLMGTREQDDDSLKDFIVGWINIFLADALEVENSVREYEGRELLTEAQTLTELDGEIEYSDRIVKVALVYDIASRVAADDEDFTHEQDFRARSVVALNEARKYIGEPITDVYSERE